MRIIKSFPPNWIVLAAAFPTIKGRQGILYAWGDTLYNPSGITVPPWLVAHEEVHGSRQKDIISTSELHSVMAWWKRYIREPKFRLDEEILAHRVEWQKYSGPYRDNYLGHMAERLSGPLYGNLISYEDAAKEITHG